MIIKQMEKEMATHSSILAWKIPWIEEPGRLQSMGSQRVGHDWACIHTQNRIRFHLSGTSGKEPCVRKIPWRQKWQPASVFLPGKSHGQRSLVHYNPWGCKRVRHDLSTKQQWVLHLGSRGGQVTPASFQVAPLHEAADFCWGHRQAHFTTAFPTSPICSHPSSTTS